MGDDAELEGFREESSGAVRALLRDAVGEKLCGLDILEPQRFFSHCEITDFGGRTSPFRLRLASGDTAIVRRYRRGGLAKAVLRNSYFGSSRPFLEAGVSEHARKSGVSTAEVLAAVHVRRLCIMHWGFIVTREIQDARPLRQAVSQDEDIRSVLLGSVPELFRAMHDCGVAHHDLTVDNVLVRGDGSVLLVDLDGCRVSEEVGLKRRLKDLLRFRRSARKNSLGIDLREWRDFFESYAGDDPEMTKHTDRWLGMFKRRLFWYRLAWRLGI